MEIALKKLLEEIEKEENTYEKLETLFTIRAIAEEKGNLFDEFFIRFEVMNTAVFLGDYEQLFNNFIWCLDKFNTYTEELENCFFHLLWSYKWFLEYIVRYPHLDRKYIQEHFDTFKNYCEKYEYTLRPYYLLLYKFELVSGNVDKAEEFFRSWLLEERDELSDCEACEENIRMEYFLNKKEYDEAFKIYSVLINEIYPCEEVPDKSHAKVLLPLWELGKIEEAKEIHDNSYLAVEKNRGLRKELTEHLLFLILTMPARAVEVIKTNMDKYNKCNDPYSQFYFYLHTWLLISKYKNKNIKLKLDIEEELLIDVIFEIARDFDNRNENEHYINTIQKTLDLA